jgi:hypothetical protein
MKTAFALILCSSLAFAQAPADAPLADEVGRSNRVEEGEITPYAGQLIDEKEMVRRERINARNDAMLSKAKESALLPVPALVAIIVGAVLLGAVAGTAVTLAVKK